LTPRRWPPGSLGWPTGGRPPVFGTQGVRPLCTDPTDPPRVLRDPNDDYLLALAASAGAQAIVTGVQDLLEHPGLHPPAITARQALEQLRLS